MEYLFAIVVGIGLAASSGFRVFVPLLVVSVAANAGYFKVAENCQWLGTWTALWHLQSQRRLRLRPTISLGLITCSTQSQAPMAVIAGAILFAASLKDFDPFWQWSLAIIAGGGSAAIVQGGTVASRLASTATTGGLANFVVSTSETLAGFFFSITSIVVPLLALILLFVVVGGMYYVGRQVMRNLFIPRSNADS